MGGFGLAAFFNGAEASRLGACALWVRWRDVLGRDALASSLVQIFHAEATNSELQMSGSYLMDFVFECALLMKSFKISGCIALAQSSLRSSLIKSWGDKRFFFDGDLHLASGMAMSLPPWP